MACLDYIVQCIVMHSIMQLDYEMDFARLRHIVAVADCCNFSRAAEQCCVSQPALSRSIAAFEAHYGVRLFDRGRGGVRVSAAGRLVVEQARALIAAAGDLEDSLSDYSRGDGGDVAFGIGPLAASLILPRVTADLLGERPRLRLRATILPPGRLLGELLDDRLELFFGHAWQMESLDVEVTSAGTMPLAVLVRSGHPLAGRTGLAMADLAGWPVASPVDSSTAGLLGAAGGFICDNCDILRATTLASDCLWPSSPAFAAQDMAEGRLVALDLADFPLDQSEIAIVRRRGRSLSPAAELLIARVCDFLAG